MLFTFSLVVPYAIIIVEHTQAQVLTTAELRGFVDSYSSTPEWAISAISVPLLSLTVGSNQSVYFDLAIVLLFIFPAAIYFNRNFPFGLWVSISDTEKLPEDMYNISLNITTGSNVEKYGLDINLPDGAIVTGFQGPNEKHHISNKHQIKGQAPLSETDFMVSISIKETTGVGSNNVVHITDIRSSRSYDSVELE